MRTNRPGDAKSSADDRQPFTLALARGLQVLRAFGEDSPRMTLADVARATGLSRATVRRCLHTLVELGYAEPDGRLFALTPRVLTLGYAYMASTPLPRIAQPFLERVSEAVHESCSMSILDGDDIVYVARSATRRIISVGLGVGSRLPAFCTSMGRVLLAGVGDEALQPRLRAMARPRLTPHTKVDVDELMGAIRDVRRAGFAFVDQELELGLRSLAVPVRRNGEIAAAINLGVQSGRVELADLHGRLLDALQEAADGISDILRTT